MVENLITSKYNQYTYTNPKLSKSSSVGNSNFEYEMTKYAPSKQQDLEQIAYEKETNFGETTFDFEQEKISNIQQNGYDIGEMEYDVYKYLEFEQIQEKEEVILNEKQQLQLKDKVNKLKEHTDAMYKCAMEEQGEINIANLYLGSFKGTGYPTEYSKEEIDQVLRLNSIEITPENQWATEKLLKVGQDVTLENISKIQNIKEQIDNLSPSDLLNEEELPIDVSKKPLIKNDQVHYTQEDINKLLTDLSEIKDEQIEELLEKDIKININNLKAILYQNTMQILAPNISRPNVNTPNISIPNIGTNGSTPNISMPNVDINGSAPNVNIPNINMPNVDINGSAPNVNIPNISTPNVDININTPNINIPNVGANISTPSIDVNKSHINKQQTVQDVKNYINIIRAKLNVEAARNISTKMPLESTELSKVAQELIAIEDVVITEALNKANVPVSEENKQILEKVIETTNQMKFHPTQTIEIQLETSEEATLEQFNVALSKYDQNALEPEKRFGEGLRSVKGQIEQFLQNNNFEVNKINKQAAEALILNNQELTPENMEQAAVISQKLNTFLLELTPHVASNMIKEGINPYYSTVDNTLEFIEKENMPQLKTSVAEAIVALEENGQLSKSQKDELIGLYQVLDKVEKNKEQVIGYIQQNNFDLNVENLQEAVKYAGKNTNIETVVDDSFGELEGFKQPLETAKVRIEQANIETEKLVNLSKVLENTQLNLKSDDKISSMIYPFIKSQVKKELGDFEGIDTLPKSVLEKIEIAKKVSPEIVSVMKDKEIPVTLNNIYWLQKMVDEPNLYGEMLKDYNEGNPDHKNEVNNFEEIREMLEEIKETASSEKEIAVMESNINQYKQHKQMEEMVNIQKELQKQDEVYQVPFMINGEQKLVHLYMNKKNKQSVEQNNDLKAVISYDTKSMGTVVAHLNITDEAISYEVSGETPEITKRLQTKGSNLDTMLKNIGYSVKQGIYQDAKIYNPILKPEQSAPVKRGDTEFEVIA
ncbi:hypothetical protein AN396_14120 [Candidatus Epulonipiscium fishelsonii]|uniref:Uncharacterized protein n=1 Tax=Candidatus Epulonipiscium fishelsonii TaxID=77094 RepID=A0ACC8XGN7_9FIRM|nr:hypothetical protein AN396_14120 [Epulopiscium sp. SCG-B11WGA-EpuloA1]